VTETHTPPYQPAVKAFEVVGHSTAKRFEPMCSSPPQQCALSGSGQC